MTLSDVGHRVRLVIPTDNESAIGPIIGRITGRWGGCTVTRAYGWWSDNDGEITRDVLSVVECSIGLWDQEARDWWTDISDVVRSEWDQTCVFLSVVEEQASLVFGPGEIVPITK